MYAATGSLGYIVWRSWVTLVINTYAELGHFDYKYVQQLDHSVYVRVQELSHSYHKKFIQELGHSNFTRYARAGPL